MKFAPIDLGRIGQVLAANIAAHPQAHLYAIADPQPGTVAGRLGPL